MSSGAPRRYRVNKEISFNLKKDLKFLTLAQRSLWFLNDLEAEEGLLGPFCC